MNIFKYTVLLLVCGCCYAQDTQEKEDSDALPLKELKIFAAVFDKIKKSYVVPVDDKTLLKNAIHGMLEGLDPHSTFLDQDSYIELQEGTSGRFGGLGIEVGMEDGFIRVIAPIDDTPAHKAGIQAGDLIIRLDKKPVKGMTLNDAVKIMRGKPGTEILLTIVRKTLEKPIQISVVRAVIAVKSVKSKMLMSGFGYARISNFQTQTAADLRRELKKLKRDKQAMLRGVILDLRNNPGGILDVAVEVADMFLSKGLIVYTEGRLAESKLEFHAYGRDILNGLPLAVLINGGSASGSEIVAGALQDNQRAVIIGKKSFGKGSVQTILPMLNDAALKLTTARYYTPSGRSIQASGIEPDVLVGDIKLAQNQDPNLFEPIKEVDLSGHLSNEVGSAPIDSKAEDAQREAEKTTNNLLANDYLLYEALNVLKALALQHERQAK